MEKYTKETGLVMYNENIFSRIKNFFWRKLKKWGFEDTSADDVNLERTEVNEEEPVKKKRSLFNYDAVDNEMQNNELNENTNEDIDLAEQSVNNKIVENTPEIINNVIEFRNTNGTQVQEEQTQTSPERMSFDMDMPIIGVNTSANQDDENDWNPDSERGSVAREEREALERKLLNFYASIKNGI